MSDSLEAEVCVLGGGPAGATVASRLARLGHDTLLVDDGRGVPMVQHLGPAIWPALAAAGARDAVTSACFPRPASRWLLWDEGVPELVAEPAEAGILVDRRQFDELLLRQARHSGARLCRPARARPPQPDGERWRVALATPAGHLEVHARFVVDATGRRPGRLPRQTGMAALYGWLRPPATPDARPRVEALDAAWCWGAPCGGGRFMAIVFVDHAAAAGLGRQGREQRYRELLERSTLLHDVAGWQIEGTVAVCDASAYLHPEPVQLGCIRVGEAVQSLDPLSSQGVQAAIRSALQASAAIHTMLRRPANAATAMQFYRRRLEQAHELHGAFTQAAYARRANSGGGAFWTSRASEPERSAYQATRRPLTGDTLLRWSRAVEWRPAPVIEGDFVCLRRAIHHPNLDGPVAFIADIAIATVLEEQATRHGHELLAQLSRSGSQEPAWQALAQLYEAGVLVAADEPPASEASSAVACATS